MRRLSLTACLLLLPSVASAYELLGASWRQQNFPDGVPYCPVINALGASTTSLRSQYAAAINAAAASWSSSGSLCSALEIHNAEDDVLCDGTPSHGSSKPWVYWEDAWGSVPGVGASTIGVTPWQSSGSQISQAKIIFNDRDFDWTVSNSNVDTDVQSIATHEFGHFYGLDHYDEFSAAKQQQCNNAVYPAVMCSFYPGGLVRAITADDVQGICYLYPNPGAIGSDCSIDGCDAGLECHDDGYCTDQCSAGSPCPAGYTCTSGLCERDVPPPTCPACQDLPCTGADTMCIGGSGSGFCTRECGTGDPCPDGYDCSELEGGGSICWPLSNTCDDSGPGPGDTCGTDYECAFGNICLEDGTNSRHCYALCDVDGDCDEGDVCNELQPGLNYCDEDFTCPPCGSMACGQDPALLNVDDGCMCAPSCGDTLDCPVGFWCVSLEGGGNACFPAGGSCKSTGVPAAGAACNLQDECRLGAVCLSNDCYTVCRSNGDCGSGFTCQPTEEDGLGYCDVGSDCSCDDHASACDAGCTCDPLCDDGCSCDVASNNCDPGCGACDPDCEGYCACDTGPGCDDTSCSCDEECEKGCACDKTTACDPDCDKCDPECPADEGCFSAAARPDGASGTGWLLVVGLMLALRRVRLWV